jgi:hypothetical protein
MPSVDHTSPDPATPKKPSACERAKTLAAAEQLDIAALSVDELELHMLKLTELFRCSMISGCHERVGHSDRALVVFQRLSEQLRLKKAS